MTSIRKPVPCPVEGCDRALVVQFIPDDPSQVTSRGMWVQRCPSGHLREDLGRTTNQVSTRLQQLAAARKGKR